MSMDRRDAVKLMGLMAAASTFGFPGCTGKEAKQAQEATSGAGHTATTQPGPDYERQFFTDHEYETVTQLADWVIPADERSGTPASEALPERSSAGITQSASCVTVSYSWSVKNWRS